MRMSSRMRGIKLKLKKSYEVKVSGLEDGEELDPFKDINVVFEGDDGFGKCLCKHRFM